MIFQPFAPIHNSTFRLEFKTSMSRLLIRNGFLQALPSFEPADQNHKRESQSENLKSLLSSPWFRVAGLACLLKNS